MQNWSFSQKSTEQNSFLITKEAGGREGSGRAGTPRELLLFPAPQLTSQGTGASLCSLNPSHSCSSISPKSGSLLYPGCDSKIIILQTIPSRHQQKWVWNWLSLMHVVSHPGAHISSCFTCLLLALSLVFGQHLFSLNAILAWALRFLIGFFLHVFFPLENLHHTSCWDCPGCKRGGWEPSLSDVSFSAFCPVMTPLNNLGSSSPQIDQDLNGSRINAPEIFAYLQCWSLTLFLERKKYLELFNLAGLEKLCFVLNLSNISPTLLFILCMLGNI